MGKKDRERPEGNTGMQYNLTGKLARSWVVFAWSFDNTGPGQTTVTEKSRETSRPHQRDVHGRDETTT